MDAYLWFVAFVLTVCTIGGFLAVWDVFMGWLLGGPDVTEEVG